MNLRLSFSIVCFAFILNLNGQNNPEILMTVGKTAVSVDEFRYIYEKNNGANADYSEKSVKEYLELYTHFKLKVEKAKELKFDTLPELKSELSGYRKQLAASYLIDKEVTENLLKELYERTKFDIEFSHIYLPFSASDSQLKKDEIKSQLIAIKSKLIAGQSFEDVAKEFSKDPNSASKGGYMGYLTAKLPSGFYQLENALYETQINQFSDIVESKIGFHIVKVLNKRPAKGQIQIAHIFIKKETKSADRLADSLYQELIKGVEFSAVASQYSADNNTNKNGGILPPFGINTYDAEFESQAFMLNSDNEISKPFQTRSGWHILKRLNKPQPDSYDIYVRKMKSQINKDERFDVAKIALIEDIKKSNGFTEDRKTLDKFASGLQDDFYSYKWTPAEENTTDKLCTIGNSFTFSLGDFMQYVKKNTKTRLKYDKTRPVTLTVNEIYQEFVNEKCIEFEERNLEYKYPDFKSLMREYEEGILLFEVTKQTVWDKANIDTVGLESFYLNHKKKYFTEEKAKTARFVIHSTDKKLAEKIRNAAKSKSPEKLAVKYNKNKNTISYTEETIEKSNPLFTNIEWKSGAVTEITTNDQAKHQSFNKITEIIPAQIKSLADARGYVVADYQDYLEKEWVKELRKEFVVIVNQPVLNTLIK